MKYDDKHSLSSSNQNLRPESTNNLNGLVQENGRLSAELVLLKGKLKEFEAREREVTTVQNENTQLKAEISDLRLRKEKEVEFNEVLKEFETNFRKKIMEVEAEKEYYKGLNREYLVEKNNFRLEKEEKIYELEMTVNQLQERLREKDRKNANSHEFTSEHNEKCLKLNEEKERLTFDLTEKTLEIGVWKEKYYELLAQMERKASAKPLTNNSQELDREISSVKIQNKELLEKMDILNRIIESHSTERENLETELRIYKQKVAESEKKPKV